MLILGRNQGGLFPVVCEGANRMLVVLSANSASFSHLSELNSRWLRHSSAWPIGVFIALLLASLSCTRCWRQLRRRGPPSSVDVVAGVLVPARRVLKWPGSCFTSIDDGLETNISLVIVLQYSVHCLGNSPHHPSWPQKISGSSVIIYWQKTPNNLGSVVSISHHTCQYYLFSQHIYSNVRCWTLTPNIC